MPVNGRAPAAFKFRAARAQVSQNSVSQKRHVTARMLVKMMRP